MDDRKLWFKAHRLGYGWSPATWQGWLVLLGFFILTFGPLFWIVRVSQTSYAANVFASWYVPYVGVLVIILLVICRAKGEPPRWRWGGDE